MSHSTLAALCLSLCLATLAVAQTPQVSGITSNYDVIDNSIVGSATFSITAPYAQAMNTAINPTFSFPDVGKDLIAVGALVPAAADLQDLGKVPVG